MAKKEKELVRLDSLKQGVTFWYKKGKFMVKNKCHKDGIECKKTGGRFHYSHKCKKPTEQVTDHEKNQLVLPRHTMVLALKPQKKHSKEKKMLTK